jgi:hypothetical protein
MIWPSSTGINSRDLRVQEAEMSDEQEPRGKAKPRLCERCGKRLPAQRRGRPRRWCTQQCRQLAYEERHGLESWADKQPKVTDLADVVEEAQDRAARREVARRHRPHTSHEHTPRDCLQEVMHDPFQLIFALEHVIDTVRGPGLPRTIEGKLLANTVVELVNAVLDQTMAVVPADACPGINPSTPPKGSAR